MAANPREFLFWLQDISQHVRVSRRRKSLRQPGRGFDYTEERVSGHQLVSHLHPKRMNLRVNNITQVSPTSKSFQLERVDGHLPPFRAGQYINVFVNVDGVLTSRPYSIASPPGGKYLELTVQNKTGGFVAPFLLNELHIGDILESTGPTGNFYHEPLIDGDELVFLAGGSGVTPFMSIIRDTIKRQSGLKIQLLYGFRTPDDTIYAEELSELADNFPNFKYSLVISEPPPDFQGLTGFLDAELIRTQVEDPSSKTFYICGPQAMYDFCLSALAEIGIPTYKIKRELYGPPQDISGEPGWPGEISTDSIFSVNIEGHNSIRTPAGEPLLNTLERYGVQVPAVCRTGECSACRVRLISGKVFMPSYTGLRQSDHQFGYIHACMSYAVEDITIRI